MGNPLQPGTYYIGVQDPNNVSSYTLQSRGIGLANYTIAVQSLRFQRERDQSGVAGRGGGLLPGGGAQQRAGLEAASDARRRATRC